jgi:hypothetical protein
MALAFASVDRTRLSNRWLTVTEVTLDTDYAGGGWAITANDLGFGVLKAVIDVNIELVGYIARYVPATGKLLVETVPNDAATGIDEAATGENALADELVYITAIGI